MLDRLVAKLEPRLESKVEENIERWRKEEKRRERGMMFMIMIRSN